jgi:hypothetical protein
MKKLAALLALALLTLPLRAEPLAFGLFGDFPYSDWERVELPKMIEAMGMENLAFVVHDGDIKSGSSECSDEVFRDILGVFQASQHPLVFVPGDNEWTDCHRKNNGAYDPLERLAKLREMYFPNDESLGRRTMKLERQSADPRYAAYRENVRWHAGGVLFVGLNVPGSNNNWFGTTKDKGPSAEYLDRSKANRAWLASSFALAREKSLPGIVLVIQANPDLESPKHRDGKPNGYVEFIEQLRDETLAFSGQVVLVHGDTHFHRIDQPLRAPKSGEPLANFTRVETYGSPTMGWVRGVVDAADPKVFRFEAQPWPPR